MSIYDSAADLLLSDHKIGAIKELRYGLRPVAGVGSPSMLLKDAKDVVDAAHRQLPSASASSVMANPTVWKNAAANWMRYEATKLGYDSPELFGVQVHVPGTYGNTSFVNEPNTTSNDAVALLRRLLEAQNETNQLLKDLVEALS